MSKTTIKQITIYCPDCGRKIMTHDGKGTIPISNYCKKCKKIITYFPESGKVKSQKKLHYESSSGKCVY